MTLALERQSQQPPVSATNTVAKPTYACSCQTYSSTQACIAVTVNFIIRALITC